MTYYHIILYIGPVITMIYYIIYSWVLYIKFTLYSRDIVLWNFYSILLLISFSSPSPSSKQLIFFSSPSLFLSLSSSACIVQNSIIVHSYSFLWVLSSTRVYVCVCVCVFLISRASMFIHRSMEVSRKVVNVCLMEVVVV